MSGKGNEDALHPRQCPTCGTTFTPTNHNQRFCPPTERNRRVAGQPRSRCARRWSNARERGSDPTLPLPGPFDCIRCGKHCVPGVDGVDPQATSYCSRTCKKASQAARYQRQGQGPMLAQLDQHIEEGRALLARRGDLRWPPNIGPNDIEAYRTHVEGDPCCYCGANDKNRRGVGVDHIVPTSSGGEDSSENWTRACHRCNGRKSRTPLLLFLGWSRAKAEFDPWRETLRLHVYNP